MDSNKPDTKEMIFNTSLRMFAYHGYENVSIRNIADAVGIKTSSIYYHYNNKDEILNACYNFFIKNRHITRLTPEQYEPILRDGTRREILEILNYSFPDEILENMILSLLTVFSHMYTDDRAKEIYVDDINQSLQYLNEFFERGIKIGRFKQFNVPAVSLVIMSARLFLAQSVTIKSEQKKYWDDIQADMAEEVMNIIPFSY